MQKSLTDWRAGSAPWHAWADTVETSREAFAELVSADANDVVAGVAVSQLLAPIAMAIPDDAVVLVPDVEFTSVVFPFAVHADRGVTVRTASVADLADAIEADTTAVAFSAVQSATGEVADIVAITSRAREVGAVTVMDGTQGLGWLPIRSTDVDVLVGSAYKWLCSPRGSAFAVLNPEISQRAPWLARRLRPLAAGWFAGDDDPYYGMPLRLKEGARRFDISPAWHSWVGTAPALRVLNTVGPARIAEHNIRLANIVLEGLDLPSSNSAIISVAIGAETAGRLRNAKIRYSTMGGRARFAFHLYNSTADAEVALLAIKG